MKHSPNTGEKKSRFKKGQLEAKIKAITNLWRGEARKEIKRQIEETQSSQQEWKPKVGCKCCFPCRSWEVAGYHCSHCPLKSQPPKSSNAFDISEYIAYYCPIHGKTKKPCIHTESKSSEKEYYLRTATIWELLKAILNKYKDLS